MESLGYALSSGSDGQGARLLLGNDILGLDTVNVLSNPNGQPSQQTLTGVTIPTAYLIAAGAPAFDPNCVNPDPYTALANNCSLVGVTTGTPVFPPQQALWDSLPPFLAYPATSWTPANLPVWFAMRGLLTEVLPSGAVGNEADTMWLLDNVNSFCNSIANVYAFTGK